MSLESKVMQSYFLTTEVIKTALSQDIFDAAARGEFELTNEQFSKISQIIELSVTKSAMNSAKQLQSALSQK